MKRLLFALPLAAVLAIVLSTTPEVATDAQEDVPDCIGCHQEINPGIVDQWRMSKHARAEPERVDCWMCHGQAHQKKDDYEKARMPTAKTCGMCHAEKADQFAKGKHALAAASVAAIPMLASQPEAIRNMGCIGCHDVGKRWDDGSVGKCDSCHTRHLFSKEEARMPEACETCHMGEDHSQFEMWRSSKHGVIHGLMPEIGRAPTCQACHMQEGNHEVRTGWGFLGLRLPIGDQEWQNDVLTIVKAIGPWDRDEAGMNARVGAIKALQLARLDQVSFDQAREKMLGACGQCHSRKYARFHLKRADQVIKESTHLMAEAIGIVEKLYEDDILPLTDDGPSHPDLLLFYDSPTDIEQELYEMFLFHRQKAFQGAIHMNPDYMHWYGWAPMKTSMRKIRALAAELRAKHGK